MDIFYYDKNQLRLLVVFNFIFLLLTVSAGEYFPERLGSISVIALICLISFSASLYVVLFPQKLAVISAEGIKIDHNALLKWQDISSADKIRVPGILKRDIILFTLKENTGYPLRLMQRISRHSPYGAFSIPLYAMKADDRPAIEAAVEKYIRVNRQA